MKKIKGIVIALLLTLTLVACNKTKLDVKVEISNIAKERSAIEFDLKVKDPNKLLEGQIVVQIFEKDKDVKKSEQKINPKNEEEFKEIRFSGLLADTYYDLKVLGTYKGKSYELHKELLNTQLSKETEIHTIEDFLDISKDRYAKYKLKNDLDFSEYDGDLTSDRISNFYGEFDGDGHTIKNFHLDSSSIYNGLFGQVGSTASIKNLVIDGFKIGSRETPSKISGSKYGGVLFGRNSSASTEIENITIRNSEINYKVDSTSENVHIGILGGTSAANLKNINIEASNTLNIEATKYSQLNIGGLLGRLEEEASLKEVINMGKINITINQESEFTRSSNRQDIRIGGLLGRNFTDKVEDIITKTDIEVSEIKYSLPKFEEKDKNKTYNYNFALGGLIGVTSRDLKNAIYDGIITVNKTTMLEEKEGLEIIEDYAIAGLIGNFGGYEENLSQVLLKESLITVSINNDKNVNISHLIGKHPRINNSIDQVKSLAIFGENKVTLNDKQLAETPIIIEEIGLFIESEWIIKHI